MISIDVNSLPIADVMADMAKAFQTSFTENCGFYELKIPKDMGAGHINGINFDSGMGILQYDCTFKEDLEFRFTVNEVHPVKFLYCLQGTLNHSFENIDKVHTINRFQEVIVASENHNGHILKFGAGKHISINSLEITGRKFRNRIQCDLVTFDESLQRLFNDENAKKLFYYEGFYSLKLADVFNRIRDFKGKNITKNLFLEGVAYQMLTEQIIQYEDDISDDDNKSVLRQAEVIQIKQAAQIIKRDIAALTGINDIAIAVGLNINKLQEGFHILYNCSINQFIQKVRLDLIKDLILNTEYNISEIVHLVGLSSKSYLSKIFREEYGMSPTSYRKQFYTIVEEKKKQLLLED